MNTVQPDPPSTFPPGKHLLTFHQCARAHGMQSPPEVLKKNPSNDDEQLESFREFRPHVICSMRFDYIIGEKVSENV